MAKKADEAEIKKECPSCGLGVSLDSKMCEFCGWDFDEEDEWILQIEKLERDLLLEKQKFEPGSVEDRIESTLKSPFYQKAEEEKVEVQPRPGPRAPTSAPKPQMKVAVGPAPVVRETKASGVKVVKPIDTDEEPAPVVRTIIKPSATPPKPPPQAAPAAAPAPSPLPVRREAAISRPPPVHPEQPKPVPPNTKKTRVVRKVKQA